jgi:hypothetical protein
VYRLPLLLDFRFDTYNTISFLSGVISWYLPLPIAFSSNFSAYILENTEVMPFLSPHPFSLKLKKLTSLKANNIFGVVGCKGEIAQTAFYVTVEIENIGAGRLQTRMSKLLNEFLFDVPIK